MSEQPVSLFTLADGALAELFDREMNRIAADILDPNTEATALREVTIKVKIKPNEDRTYASVAAIVDSKVGSPRPVGTMFFFGKRGNQAVAVERLSRQQELFKKSNLVDISTGEVKDGAQ